MATPLSPNQSANFTSHALVSEGSVWRFRPTAMGRVLPRAVTAVGTVVAIAGALAGLSNPLGFVGLGAGLLLVVSGRRIAARYDAGARFDTASRTIALLKTPLFSSGLDLSTATDTLRFDAVEAIELLAKEVSDTDVTFVGVELNLVLKDGTRRNVVDHSNGAQLATEAATLARVLGVPVRDAR